MRVIWGLLIIVFVLGWVSSSAYNNIDHGNVTGVSGFPKRSATGMGMFTNNTDVISPYDRISQEQIKVDNGRVIVDIEGVTWTGYADTNSMDPVIDAGANGLEIVPKLASDIHEGDIVAYQPESMNELVVHRVYNVSSDNYGWYAVMKGDNNLYPDPGKVRFDQVKYVLVGILY